MHRRSTADRTMRRALVKKVLCRDVRSSRRRLLWASSKSSRRSAVAIEAHSTLRCYRTATVYEEDKGAIYGDKSVIRLSKGLAMLGLVR